MDTDYKTYAVLWSCEARTFGHSTREVILTREQRPGRNVLRTATRVLGANTKHKLSSTVQGNCPRQASQCIATESNQLGSFTTMGALVFLKKTLTTTSLPIISMISCCDGPSCNESSSNTSSSTPSSMAATSKTTPFEVDSATTIPTSNTESNSPTATTESDNNSPNSTSVSIMASISSTLTGDSSSTVSGDRVI
ncbi:hypothetical protein B566_EDAN015855 [Ephemera danica]|nr:hypothetical protein B566_EDAN015855 [Ephemera danica]